MASASSDGGALFEEVAAGAGVERAAEIAGAGEGGEDDDAGFELGLFEGGGEFEAGHFGHFDVGDEDVGGEASDELEGFAAVGGLGDDGDVGFELEERGEGAAEHGLVFGEEDADLGGGHGFRRQFGCSRDRRSSGGARVQSQRSVSGQSSMVKRELDEEAWCRWCGQGERPPRDSTRSRMPRRPLPSRVGWCAAPSSSTRRRWWPSST